MNINKLFEDIQEKAIIGDEKRFHVTSLKDLPHKLGSSEEGFPKFFIILKENTSELIKNLNAELLSVEYDVLCNIVEGDQEINDQLFTIITLRSDNEQLQKTFIDVFYMMLKTIPAKPLKKNIAAKVESLLSIFAKLKHKPIHKLQGLWAEMLLIESSLNPTEVARAWHSSPQSKYDFTLGVDKIEVKSTSSENRIHHFSLDQLNPSENSNLLICSIIIRESGKDINGLSIFDLYDKISMKISDDETRLHVYNVMLDTLGSDFYSAKNKYFDYSSAVDNLALYDYKDIPRINKAYIPEHVCEVRFSADLSHLEDIRVKGYDKCNSNLYNSLY